jgi:hypothetical protein
MWREVSDMADNEYIKRSEVVALIEDKLKRCETVLEALAFASLRTEVMGLRSADVEPREEVAREIFEKIRNILNKHYYACYQNEDGDECDAVISYLSYVAVDFDRLEQKYTGAETEPPKKGDHHE